MMGDQSERNTPMDVVPVTAEEHKEHGNKLYREQNYVGAVDCYSKAIEAKSDEPAYYNNRGAAYIMVSKYTEALADAVTCCELDPKSSKFFIRRGKCCLLLGDLNDSLTFYKQVLSIEPKLNITEAENQIILIGHLQNQLEICNTQAEKGDHRHALFSIQQCIDASPGSSAFKLKKAELLIHLKKYSEAKGLLEDFLQRTSNGVCGDALYYRGLCLYYLEQLDKAQSHFQHVLRLNPDHTMAQQAYKRCKLLSRLKEEGNEFVRKCAYTKAYNTYTQAITVDPDHDLINAKLYCNRSFAAFNMSKFAEALVDCEIAIKLDDTYSKAYVRRVKCYLALEKYDEAVDEIKRICETDPSEENRRLLKEAKLELKKSKRKDYYKILGITKSASESDIKKAYRKRALLHHPDRHTHADEDTQKEEEKRFKEVGEAYNVLSDSTKKQRYDDGADIEDLQNGSSGFQGGGDPYELFGKIFRDFNPNQFHGQGGRTGHSHGHGSNFSFNFG